MIPESLFHLPHETLSALHRCIREERTGIPARSVLRQILGSDVQVVHDWLTSFQQSYGNALAAQEVIAGIIQGRGSRYEPESLFDLILSGPEVKDVPTCDTLPTIHHLIHEAKASILICDYAVYGVESIFTHLREALQKTTDLRVRLVMNVFPDQGVMEASDVIADFRDNFLKRHWRAERLPEIYVDPRSLHRDPSCRASMHAKCFVSDDKAALITSANLTDAAHRKNIEAGVIVRYPAMVKRLIAYFNGLIDAGLLIPVVQCDAAHPPPAG